MGRRARFQNSRAGLLLKLAGEACLDDRMVHALRRLAAVRSSSRSSTACLVVDAEMRQIVALPCRNPVRWGLLQAWVKRRGRIPHDTNNYREFHYEFALRRPAMGGFSRRTGTAFGLCRRAFVRGGLLALTLMALNSMAQAVEVSENAAPTEWWMVSGQTAADVNSTLQTPECPYCRHKGRQGLALALHGDLRPKHGFLCEAVVVVRRG